MRSLKILLALFLAVCVVFSVVFVIKFGFPPAIPVSETVDSSSEVSKTEYENTEIISQVSSEVSSEVISEVISEVSSKVESVISSKTTPPVNSKVNRPVINPPVSRDANPVADTVITVDTETAVPKLNITPILQKPELPTGCEATAATMLLRCYGITVDKCAFAGMVTKSSAETYNGRRYNAHPSDAFIGNPANSSSFGVFSPPIANAMQRVIDKVGLPFKAHPLVGEPRETIETTVSGGTPMLVWVTMSLINVKPTISWYIKRNGVYTDELFTWPGNEHCVVLYAINGNTVSVYDPLKGNVQYEKEKFFTRYNDVGKYAVKIEK